ISFAAYHGRCPARSKPRRLRRLSMQMSWLAFSSCMYSSTSMSAGVQSLAWSGVVDIWANQSSWLRARTVSLRSAWCRASCLSRTAPTTAVVRETAAPAARTAVVSFIGQRSFRRAESRPAGRLVENLGVACSRGPCEDDGGHFIGGAVRRVAAAHRLESDGKRRQAHGCPACIDGRRRAQRAQLDPVGAQRKLGAVLLVAPAGAEGTVVQVRPVLDERVAGLDRTPEQGGGGALEGG